MSFLKENFERLKKEGLQETFDVLELAFKKYGIDYYLVGARARDLWTDHISLGPKRTTEDVDLCIYINDYNQYRALVKDLVELYGFSRDEKEAYRFYHKGTVDLIPFGGIEKNGEVFLDNPPISLSVYGTKEAVSNAEVVERDFRVITLAGLCILKLIAFYEKPDQRAKDLEDFYFILENYGQIAGDQLFDRVEHEDLITDEFELPVASARLLGRQLKSISLLSPDLSARLIHILTRKLQGFTVAEIDSMYRAREKGDKLIERFKLVRAVLQGLND